MNISFNQDNDIATKKRLSPRPLEAVNVERWHEPQIGRVEQRRHPLLLAKVGRQVLKKKAASKLLLRISYNQRC